MSAWSISSSPKIHENVFLMSLHTLCHPTSRHNCVHIGAQLGLYWIQLILH